MQTTTFGGAGRPSTIRLKTPHNRYDEARAAGTVTPGHLVKRDTANAVVVHATSGGMTQVCVVTEDLQLFLGKGIDDSYASGDLVSVIYPNNGDELLMWLADGENVVIGDKLISAGDGTLKKTTGSPTQYIADAVEAMDLTGGGNTTAQRIKVRIQG